MQQWGSRLAAIFKKVMCPPNWFCWLFGIGTIAGVALVFFLHAEETITGIIVESMSALGFYYLIRAGLVPVFRHLKEWLLTIPVCRRYVEDREFHARVLLYSGTLFNLLFAVLKLGTGIQYRSEWLISIGIYYAILVLIRFILIRRDARMMITGQALDMMGEWKTYRMIGILLFLINIGLSGIAVQVIRQNKSYSYSEFIIFGIAAYTFYRIAVTIVRMVRIREEQRPVFKAARAIDFCIAVIALYTLQTAMLAMFTENPDRVMIARANILTGTGAALIVTGIAVRMMITGTRQIRHSDRPADEEKDEAK